MSRICAAIDIGSNTVRLMVAEASRGNPPWCVKTRQTCITRLGQRVYTTHHLQETAMQRTLNILRDFSGLLAAYHVAGKDVIAVATSAVRESVNGQDFLNRVRTETGIMAQVISGHEEARLCLQGVTSVLLPRFRHDVLLVDPGGGSTEFICAHDAGLKEAISRRLGVVSLAETYLRNDPPTPDEYHGIMETAMEHLLEIERSWGVDQPPETLIGAAGTFTSLAALHLGLTDYDANRINNHVITHAELLRLRDRLLAMTHAQRAMLPFIGEGRADLIVAGLAIAQAIVERWRYTQLVTVDAGLLEGAWLELLKR